MNGLELSKAGSLTTCDCSFLQTKLPVVAPECGIDSGLHY